VKRHERFLKLKPGAERRRREQQRRSRRSFRWIRELEIDELAADPRAMAAQLLDMAEELERATEGVEALEHRLDHI